MLPGEAEARRRKHALRGGWRGQVQVHGQPQLQLGPAQPELFGRHSAAGQKQVRAVHDAEVDDIPAHSTVQYGTIQ